MTDPRRLQKTRKTLSTDRVRQLWEVSKNEGRTWITLFDGTYVKRS